MVNRLANRNTRNAGWFFRQTEGLTRELRGLPSHILQDIGIEPHLVNKDVTQNSFFITFHA